MSRLVKILTPKSDSWKSIETNAETWGELKNHMENEGISADGLKGMIKESKQSLEVEGAELPNGSFMLYLFPMKIKSGIDLGLFLEDFKNQLSGAIQEMEDRFEDGRYEDEEPKSECEECDERDELLSELGLSEEGF